MATSRRLPDKPHLTKLRAEARALHKAILAGDPEARSRVADVRPDTSPESLGLTAAQCTVAREYGFTNWAELKEHVEVLSGPERSQIERLRRRFDAGNRDEGLVTHLSRALYRAGRWHESAALLEQVATESRDWTSFGQILARYNRAGDYAACVRCQRKRLDYGSDLPLPMQTLLWQPSGTAQTIAKAGEGDWALRQLDEILKRAGHLCSAYSRCQLERSQMNVHHVEERWDEVLRIGWRYTEWVRALPPDDPQLMTPPESIEPEEPILLGERLRWWSVAFMVGTGVAQALGEIGGDRGAANQQLIDAVDSMEAECRRSEPMAETGEQAQLEHGWNLFQLRRTCGYAAQGWIYLGRYDDSLRAIERISQLGYDLKLEERIWLAGALAGAGQLDEARRELAAIDMPRSDANAAVDVLHRIAELVEHEADPGVAGVLARWRQLVVGV